MLSAQMYVCPPTVGWQAQFYFFDSRNLAGARQSLVMYLVLELVQIRNSGDFYYGRRLAGWLK